MDSVRVIGSAVSLARKQKKSLGVGSPTIRSTGNLPMDAKAKQGACNRAHSSRYPIQNSRFSEALKEIAGKRKLTLLRPSVLELLSLLVFSTSDRCLNARTMESSPSNSGWAERAFAQRETGKAFSSP